MQLTNPAFKSEGCDECSVNNAEEAKTMIKTMPDQVAQVTYTPLPWDLQIGEDRCFHDGNRVAITKWYNEDSDEPTNVTIAEIWPTSGDEDIADGQFIMRAVHNFEALVSALADARESLSRLPDVDGAYRQTCIKQIDAVLKTVKQEPQ